MKPQTCKCAETKVGNEYHYFPHHSCAEVRRRNAFLPMAHGHAEMIANAQVDLTSPGEASRVKWGNVFTKALSRRMEELCSES